MSKKWTTIIKPKKGWFNIHLGEVWDYRDLIKMFIKRDFTTQYKQTLLGPLWYIINPLLTTVIFNIIFGTIAGLATDGSPKFIFYMAGNILWSYFSTCITQTSNTFVLNAPIFGKVYFPRLTTPISTVMSGLINFAVQFIMFLCFLIYFYFTNAAVSPNLLVLMTPLLVLQMALLGIGFGTIISSLTTKYRDLTVLVTFGVQLWMYATPVVYPLSSLSGKLATALALNPMTPIIEIFRYAFLGSGTVPWLFYCISWGTTLIVLFIGTLLFSNVEKTFMDTV